LNSTNLLTLSRHMGVRRLFWIDLSTQILSLIVTVTWAIHSPSVWALVGGNLISNLYRLVLSHNRRITPGIRNVFCWDKESLNSIVHFGKWILLGTAFFFFASQSDRLILGKYISLSLLGVYGIAFSLSDIPRAVILAFSSKVGYPFIAKIIHLPRDEFRAKYLDYRKYALLIGALLLSTMVTWGDQIIRKLYDIRYHEAAWMIPILALGLWHTLLYTTTSPVLFSLGKSKYNAFGNAGYCLAIIAGIPIAFHYYGMLGAVIAVAAGDFPLYLVTQIGAVREGIKPLWQDLQMTLVFLALLVTEFMLRRYL
jgi:O-antigen/teichoic acid export membrane protein